MKRIDLHIHTNQSDGALSPIEIIDEAKKQEVYTIAIADHDTVGAYTKELFEYAENNGINIITAVEISTRINKCGIHVLGYNIDISNTELINKLKTLRNARHDYLYKVSNKLMELGYIIDIEQLDKIETVTKAHIALNIINNEKNKEILLKNFKHVPSKGEFIETIMNEKCPAYVKKETVTPKEAASIIKKAGGKVVLAHPVAYVYEDNLTDTDISNIIYEMHADGIEANYLYTDRNNHLINETEKWNKFAKDNNLFVTIGSDFHIKDGKHVEIGFTNTNFVIDDKTIDEILNNVKK